jgi:hypothetical protein
LPLLFLETDNSYLIKTVLFRHQRFPDWKDSLAFTEDFRKPLFLTPHACTRYMERYRQGITIDQAKEELRKLIEYGGGEITGVPPEWLICSRKDKTEMFLTFLDGEIVLPIVFSGLYQDYVVKTVISGSMAEKVNKKLKPKRSRSKKFLNNEDQESKQQRIKERKKKHRHKAKQRAFKDNYNFNDRASRCK